jgi:hypothetical protein
MKSKLKTIIAICFALLFSVKAFAEITMSGYQEFWSGSGNQDVAAGVSGGVHGIDKGVFSNGIYSRIMLTSATKLDSGIDVTGSYTFTRDCRVDTDNCGVSANENSVAFGGAFGTIAFGETGTAGTSMHSRMTAGIPTAEPDGIVYLQYVTSSSSTYTGPNETKYASNPMTLKYFSNSYEGFSLGVSFTPNSAGGGGVDSDTNNGQTNDYTGGNYNDLTEYVIAYSGEFEGVGVGVTYGYGTGNAGTQGSSEYEDLSENTYSLSLSYGGFSADYRTGDRGDSGRIKNDGSGGQEYSAYCGMYSMGSMTIGLCEEDSDFTTASAGVNNQSTQTIAAGYALGGGVNFDVARVSFEQTDNGVVQTDADILLARVSFGF